MFCAKIIFVLFMNDRAYLPFNSFSFHSTSAAELMDMYSGKQNDKDKIFENIKLQKEIMGSLRTQPWPMKKKLKTLQYVSITFQFF